MKSFSLNHTLPYSIIAVQEANLATRWDPLYWQCACLCVNAGNYAGEMGDDDEEEENEEIEEEEDAEDEKKAKRAAPNYGKISKAICASQLAGVNIELPDINESQIDFIPDIKRQAIIYSLQAINVVSDDLLDRIIDNRPYTSTIDFYERVQPTIGQMIGLIKAGCFDNLYKISRLSIMSQFLDYLAEKEISAKEKLTAVQLKKAISLNMPELQNYIDCIRAYKYKVYLEANCIDPASKRYIIKDEQCIRYFNMYIVDKLNAVKEEYTYLPDSVIAIKVSALKKVIEGMMSPLMTWFNSQEGLDAFTSLLRQNFVNELKEKYCLGTQSKWEMDTMGFYKSGHELSEMNDVMYGVRDFNTLKSGEKPCAIAGTIIEVINAKHTVTLLTKYGVVDVKFYGNNYIKYNQKISEIDASTKKKIVLDDSWFKRGNKILVYGFRREDTFVARAAKTESGYGRLIGLIEQVNLDGSINVRYTRNKKR